METGLWARATLTNRTVVEAFTAQAFVLRNPLAFTKPLVGSQSMCATSALHPDEVRAWLGEHSTARWRHQRAYSAPIAR